MKQTHPCTPEQQLQNQFPLSSFQEQVLELKSLLKKEREIGIRILEILSDIDRDKKYLVEGYSSLFSLCVEALGMSESQAYTRIVCLREMGKVPSLKQEIMAGTIKPTQVVELVKSIKQASRPVSPQMKQDLIESLKNLTKEETKVVLVEKLELPKTHKLTLELSPELKARLEHFKQTCSHRLQTGSAEEILGFLLSLAEKHIPQMKRGGVPFDKANRKEPIASKEDLQSGGRPIGKHESPISHDAHPVFTSPVQVTARHSRYIPASIRDLVLARSNHRCEYQNPTKQHRCSNRHFLQFDHITPYSKQGASKDPENIQLLCSAHNQWKGTEKFIK